MIYLISNEKKQIKIGSSKSPQKRLKQLQTGNASKLKLEAFYDVPDYYEKRLHYLLRQFRCRHNNEWFNISLDSLIDLLDDVLPF